MGDDTAPIKLVADGGSKPAVGSKVGSGFNVAGSPDEAVNSDVCLDSAGLVPKPGVLVEIGKVESLAGSLFS